ncbi:adenylate kinase [Cryptosporidium andersoni]|uniref:Adenylate kinase isoenzyme 6 homolog n=1 Tax=Cryptosporidium andersoni TaxID=117008 RepID=A0A1J4MR12_9CRYT|nr:adenylate kinase [Cryptosporidium andersoni]
MSMPNILVTGTPGTGKTKLSKMLGKKFRNYKVVELSKVIKKRKLFSEWDDEMESSIFNETMVIRYLQKLFKKCKILNKPIILDFHSVDFLSAEWFDIVICLRVETDVLYDRLKERSYPNKKIKENIECEIFNVIYEDITSKFGEGKIISLSNNNLAQQKRNLIKISDQVTLFKSRF